MDERDRERTKIGGKDSGKSLRVWRIVIRGQRMVLIEGNFASLLWLWPLSNLHNCFLDLLHGLFEKGIGSCAAML